MKLASVVLLVALAPGVSPLWGQTVPLFDPFSGNISISVKPIQGGATTIGCTPGSSPLLYSSGGYYGCTSPNVWTLFAAGTATSFGTLSGGTNTAGSAMAVGGTSSLTYGGSPAQGASTINASHLATFPPATTSAANSVVVTGAGGTFNANFIPASGVGAGTCTLCDLTLGADGRATVKANHSIGFNEIGAGSGNSNTLTMTAGGLLTYSSGNINASQFQGNTIISAVQGGTGANNVVGTAGHVLRSNGSAYADSAIQGSDLPSMGAPYFLTANNLSEGTAATMRTNLGLGSSAIFPTGTSGAVVGLLNANLTFSGTDTFSATTAFTNVTTSATFTGPATFGGTVAISGNLTTNVTGGGLQCLHVNNAGVVSGTTVDCGSGGGGGGITQLTGNVTTPPGSTGSTVATIPASTISLAMMANLAAGTVIGNNGGSPTTPVALTATQLTAMLPVCTGNAAGTVPSGSSGLTSVFLRGDCAWATPPGGGASGIANTSQSVSGTSVSLSNAFGTANIIVNCYDNSGNVVEYNSLQVSPTTPFAATVTFTPTFTGRCVMNGSGATTGFDTITSGAGPNTTTLTTGGGGSIVAGNTGTITFSGSGVVNANKFGGNTIISATQGGSGLNNTVGAAGHVLRSNGTTGYADSAILTGDLPTVGAPYFLTANNLSEGTAATMRTNLGLGTAATAATGTSAHTVPFLDGVLTFSGADTFSSTLAVTGDITSDITGAGFQCVHASASGVLAGTGSDCGSSGGTITSVQVAGTANQITVAGGGAPTCTLTSSGTCTVSLPAAVILGTDNTTAGTLQLANSAATAHTIWSSGATTTNTIKGFATVPTTGDVVSCTTAATTCTLTDGGVLAANLMTNSSNFTNTHLVAATGNHTTQDSGIVSTAVVVNSGANTAAAGMTLDMHAATSATGFIVPVIAGAAPATNGSIAYDSTNNMLHAAQTSADAMIPQFTGTPVNNNCVKWVVSGSHYTITDQGAACGSAAFQANGSPLTSSATINFQNSAATNGLTLTFANPSAGNVQLGFTGTLTNAGLANSTVTVNGSGCLGNAGSIALGATGTVTSANCVNSTAANTAGASMTLNMSAASATAGFLPPAAAGASPSTAGVVAFDTTNNNLVFGNGSTTNHDVYVNGGTPGAGVLHVAGSTYGATSSTIATADIAANAVTLAKLATQANNTILGNNSGGAAVPSALNAAQVSTLLGLGTASTQSTGTSGAVVPLLNGNNTYSGTATFSSTITTAITGSATQCVQASTAGVLSGLGDACGTPVHVLISTTGPVTDPGNLSDYQFNNATGALTFNLPAGVAGLQRCYRNATGKTGAITIQAATGNTIDVGGTNGSSAGTLVSGTNAGASVCLVSDATNHWYAYVQSGSWTNN